MYTLSVWKGQLRIVVVDLQLQDSARKVRDPFEAIIPGGDTRVSRMINVNPKFPEKSPGYRSSRSFALEIS